MIEIKLFHQSFMINMNSQLNCTFCILQTKGNPENQLINELFSTTINLFFVLTTEEQLIHLDYHVNH